MVSVHINHIVVAKWSQPKSSLVVSCIVAWIDGGAFALWPWLGTRKGFSKYAIVVPVIGGKTPLVDSP